MSELGFWKRWAGRVSTGLLAAAGAQAAPVLHRVRAGTVAGPEATGVPLWLGARDLLRVRHAAGARVQSLHGHVWVTQDGDPRDVVLAPGESLRLDRSTLALVAPLGSAQVLVLVDASGG